MRLILRFLHEILSDQKKTIKLHLLRARWRIANANNRTIPNTLFNPRLVKVGIGTYGHLNVHSYGSPNEGLNIGNYCSIAGGVHFILGGQHEYKRLFTYPFQTYYGDGSVDATSKGKIVIEDDVWIGYGSIVLSGVTIGRGAVISAGSIVPKNVPPYAIWIGNRIKGYRFSEEIIQKLETIDLSTLSAKNVIDSGMTDLVIDEENIDLWLRKIGQE